MRILKKKKEREHLIEKRNVIHLASTETRACPHFRAEEETADGKHFGSENSGTEVRGRQEGEKKTASGAMAVRMDRREEELRGLGKN